jgi:predicted glycogen debranching enzyme
MATPSSPTLEFTRDICCNLAAAESREWLVTNGIGGFASGTVAGSFTRRYHGLLIAALQPPGGRTQLVGAVDEIVRFANQRCELAAHHWASGAIVPQGFQFIHSFRLEGTSPMWTYALGEARIEKRVWMRQGENTTYIQYRLAEASGDANLELKLLVNYRDFHSLTHAGDWRMRIEPVAHGVEVAAFEGATPFYLRCIGADCEPQHIWYGDCFFSMERERGLDDHEDQLFAAAFRAPLTLGESITLVVSTNEAASLDGDAARAAHEQHDGNLRKAWSAASRKTKSASEPPWLQQLVLAADQFLVKRVLPVEPDGNSIIAGYHWFCDWGRDTMIALPGLALATGRYDVARRILLAFARCVDRGMLPNNFPEDGCRAGETSKPGYNTIDATLWLFEAARQYAAATKDIVTLQTLYPVFEGIVEEHVEGTRYNIHVDPADGLLYGGGPGIQLTWMDAKIGDWVVTPRTGKPVEVNALWINALEAMKQFAQILRTSAERFEKLSDSARKSFAKFWNVQRNCCFDVIDSPGVGSDSSLRPNQIFAVSLPIDVLTNDQRKAIVDICAERLLTPVGLRSLAPGEQGYTGNYAGGPRKRDAAYHQGTVWGWLMGPFVLAHLRVYNDREATLRFLNGLAGTMDFYGLGTLGEIFDGDAPHAPRGCIAQAWTVAEVLRAWRVIQAA